MTRLNPRQLGYPGAGRMMSRCYSEPRAWPWLLILAAAWIAAVMA